MNRKDFLKSLGMAGIGSFMLPSDVSARPKKQQRGFGGGVNCELIPSETEGPFPLDLTENPTFFRQDVRENKTGAQLNLKVRIIGSANCLPMQNVRVNIWHCDKDGLYSGYSQNNNPGQAGLTYLRGYQMTDVNGEAEFITIFPGWYTGRICHIHFQVYVSSMYKAISQLTFPIAEKNAIYAANPGLYTKGADPLNYNQDNIFADGYNLQLATLTANPDTGGYDSFLEATVQGNGVSGYASVEPETGGQFKLGQNFPNPYAGQTVIPFTLNNRSKVQIDLFDINGQKLATLDQGELLAGNQEIAVDTRALGLPTANYIYQLQVVNENGTFRQCKMMTAVK